MGKPRIFLGSSAEQSELLQELTRRLEDVAHVEPWTTSFNPGTTTLGRLLELTREVDFAAFVFAQDDWTSKSALAAPAPGQASPRDNVVFEAGLFGGVLGMRRTFILHASGAKLPTDLLGLTCKDNGRSGISVGGASRVRIDTCNASGNGAAQVRTEAFAIVQIVDSTLDPASAPAIVKDGGRVIEGE